MPSGVRVRRTPAILGFVAILLIVLGGCSIIGPRPAPSRTAESGHSYFLDCSSAHRGHGGRSAPWNTLDAVASHAAFRPLDRILLRRGTTCHGRLTPRGSGTASAPITVGAYGTGSRPLVSGDGTPSGTGSVQLTNQHDWVVQDVAISNSSADGPNDTVRSGILVLDHGGGVLADIRIRRTVVFDVTSDPGVYTAGGIVVLVDGSRPTDQFNNVIIDHNEVRDVGRVGIDVWSSSYPTTYITTVAVSSNQVNRAQGDSILMFGVSGGVIDHNISRNGGHLPPCPQCSALVRSQVAGIWPTRSNTIAMLYNEVSGENASGGDGEGFDIDIETSGVVMHGNTAHDNGGGGVLICGTSGADVQYNVFQNDGGGEISFSCTEPPTNVSLTNNTIAVPANSAVVRRVEGFGTADIRFANNLVLNPSGDGFTWPGPVVASTNIVTGPFVASAPYRTGSPDVAPLLAEAFGMRDGIDTAAAYTPAPGSAAIGGGTSIAGASPVDFFGTAVAQVGIGALTGSRDEATPPQPAAPTAKVIPGGASLAWTGAAAYPMQVQRSSDGVHWQVAAQEVISATFVDRGLAPGTWRYRLLAVGRNRLGPPSTIAPARVP